MLGAFNCNRWWCLAHWHCRMNIFLAGCRVARSTDGVGFRRPSLQPLQPLMHLLELPLLLTVVLDNVGTGMVVEDCPCDAAAACMCKRRVVNKLPMLTREH